MGTYSNDDRFVVSHNRPMQNWELHVKFVKPSDEGLYECQISTHPPSSIFVKLRVVEAKAEILGEPDKHVRSGSTFELVCVLRDSTEPPVYVFWYHNDRMINYDNERGVVVSSDVEKSILTIQEAQKSDSGNYTCQPSNASPSWIVVHILNGEKPAAMQHGSRSGGGKIQNTCSPSSLFFVTSLLYFLLTSWLTWSYQVSSTKTPRGNPHESLSPHYYPRRPLKSVPDAKKQSKKKEGESCLGQVGVKPKRELDLSQTGRLSSFPKSEGGGSETSSCVSRLSHSLGSVGIRRIFSRLESSSSSHLASDGGPTAVACISSTKVTSPGCSAASPDPHLNSTCFPVSSSPSNVSSVSMRVTDWETHPDNIPSPRTHTTPNNCSNSSYPYQKFPSVVDSTDGR
ncbi:unnamed protein product [Allacma fusca]|uniref:Ig-like domain-containing protein n=1 Tax=Allacma fusca TaxID=39272 RepID=A0A8J2KTG5_9HEXA|nr:unnamed protein product [Allacma fusca]